MRPSRSITEHLLRHARAPIRLRVVTLAQLNRALAHVVRELDAFGLWNDRVEAVEVRLVTFGEPYGWHWSGGSGAISIPQVSLSRVKDLVRGRHTSLTDVLRHEYAHAIASSHRGLVRARNFHEAFEASHDDESEFEHDPELHVTRYASSMAKEDFAEVFMLWLRHAGRMPRRFQGLPAIERKWRFVTELVRAIRAGKRRW